MGLSSEDPEFGNKAANLFNTNTSPEVLFDHSLGERLATKFTGMVENFCRAWSKEDSFLAVEDKEAHMQKIKSVSASLLYGVVALVMGFVNKGILQLWPYSNTLLTLQMAASIATIYSGKYLNLLHVRPLQLSSARSLFPVVFFYNANVAFALAGLQVLNIPIFNALKRLTPVLVILGKFAMGEGLPSREVLLSVCVIVIGCVIASLGDLSFDLLGYALALTSCVLQSTYLILVEKSGKEQGYNSHELLLYNAALSLPVLLLLIFVSGEGMMALSSFLDNMGSSSTFFALLIFSLAMGSLLNYSLFLCTLWNSALTTTVVGAMKAVVSSVLGFFVLGGVKATLLVVLGVVLNTLGGIWYAVVKYRQKHQQFVSSLSCISKDYMPRHGHMHASKQDEGYSFVQEKV